MCCCLLSSFFLFWSRHNSICLQIPYEIDHYADLVRVSAYSSVCAMFPMFGSKKIDIKTQTDCVGKKSAEVKWCWSKNISEDRCPKSGSLVAVFGDFFSWIYSLVWLFIVFDWLILFCVTMNQSLSNAAPNYFFCEKSAPKNNEIKARNLW